MGVAVIQGTQGARYTLTLPASPVVEGGKGVSRFLYVAVAVDLSVAMIQGTVGYSITPLP